MTAAKFTPGPWSWGYNPHSRTDMPHLASESGEVVCDFGNCERYYPTEGTPPSLADSRLIAAAPELLAALVKCVAQLEMITGKVHDERCALYDGLAAIAKATGATP